MITGYTTVPTGPSRHIRQDGMPVSHSLVLVVALVPVRAGARQVDDAAGDVDRVRAKSFVVARDQGHLHRDGDRHLPGGQFGGEA